MLSAITFDAQDPARLTAFWSGLLGPAFEESVFRFVPADEPRAPGLNRAHFDLTSASLDDQRAIVDRALTLGGSHLDIGQGEVDHVVLADPEGNEFCVIEPGNSFLAGTGAIGCLAGDGSAAVGRFWSAALGWPLVWDQDEETAIQSPAGGTKISWGGPPVEPVTPADRVHYVLSADTDVTRLIALGATPLDGEGLVLADPDGNVFRVVDR
jgi:hypothetical protein